MLSVHVVSLGCSKNRVETEIMMGSLRAAGAKFVEEPLDADLVLINTCGFIAPARAEAQETLARLQFHRPEGQVHLVVGCYSQYRPEEVLAIPGVDAIAGVGFAPDMAALAARAMAGEKFCELRPDHTPEALAPRVATLEHVGLLRIAEGCSNRCAYCAIPTIRGPLRSLPWDDVIKQAKRFAAQGVAEIDVIAQDTARWGQDLGEERDIADLIVAIADAAPRAWIRLMYTYSDGVTDKLLGAIGSRANICRYLDVPIQHTHDDVLAAMGRRGTTAQLADMITRARTAGMTLRTTVMVGFPGESDAHFAQMREFLQAHPFDRLGCFVFSPEEGTPAAAMPGRVPTQMAQWRAAALMRQQEKISKTLLKRRVSTTEQVLCESCDGDECSGRSMAEAPDVDGMIYWRGTATPGTIVPLRIRRVDEHDLLADPAKN